MSTGESKDSPRPGGKGDGSPESPAKSEESDSSRLGKEDEGGVSHPSKKSLSRGDYIDPAPGNSVRFTLMALTSVLAVDSEGHRLKSYYEAVDPLFRLPAVKVEEGTSTGNSGRVVPKSPSSLNSPTSVLEVDSEGCFPDLWPESRIKSKEPTSGKSVAMSPIKPPPEELLPSVQKPAPAVMFGRNDTSCVNFDDEDPKMKKFSQFDRAHEAPRNNNQNYGSKPLEDNEVSPNARLADDSKREIEVKTPVDNKTHLNAGEHVVSSSESISKMPLVGDKVSLNADLLAAWEKELESWMPAVGNETHLNAGKHAVSSEESIPKIPLESLSSLAPECDTGSSSIQENIEILVDHYSLLRRMQNDGNTFYRAFLVAYMEYFSQSKDAKEVTRVKANMRHCMNTLEAGGCYPAIF